MKDILTAINNKMSTYESESDGVLQIRQQRGQASNTVLTPENVRRVYGSVRAPNTPTRRRRMSDTIPIVNDDGYDPTTLYNFMFEQLQTGIGVGNPQTPPSVTTAPTTSTGVGMTTVRPSTSQQGVVSGRVGVGGKTPRQPTVASTRLQARRRRREREAAALRRVQRQRGATTAAAGGGDDGGGGGSSSDGGSGGSRRGRRLNNDLDRLLASLRRRTDGRHIAGITHTDTITTTYKDGRPPRVQRSSTRSS